MAVLTDEMKTYIVMALARFDTPTKIAEAVQSTFGIEVTRHQVHRYDPDCAEPPAARWCDLHAATRKTFLANIARIGVAHKTVRLKLLDEMAMESIESHYFLKAATLLEQAARECGGIYERKNAGAATATPTSDESAGAPVSAPELPR